MVSWSDIGIILSCRPYGETAAIVNLLTLNHGRQAGLVQGGQSRRMRGLLQCGNQVEASWQARLHEQLGQFKVNLTESHAAKVFDDALCLSGLASVCAIAESCLPEREPMPEVFSATMLLLDAITDSDIGNEWLIGYIKWELRMLQLAGYGLKLDCCGVTGVEEGLAYVSPRTGVAVTVAGAGVHADRLMHLPQFLGGISQKKLEEDLLDGMQLTAHFLERQIFGLYHQPLPLPRQNLMALAEKKFGNRKTIKA